MKNFIYRVLTIFAIIVIIFNIFSALELDFFGFRMFRVGSGSMEPYLKVGDLIIIIESASYEIGDVVTFKQNESYITHKIISKNGDEIVTKGDANNTNDAPIKEKDIVGKMFYKLNIINFINYIFSKPLSWGLLFFIGLLITILIPDKKEKGKHAN